jgi:transposase
MSKQTTAEKELLEKAVTGTVTIGIDIGDRWSHYCILDKEGEIVEQGRFRTTATSVGKHFQQVPRARIAMEAGTHSIWLSEQLHGYGHEVIVANVTELHAIVRNIRKSDQVDAEKLARYARLDPRILRPITPRSVEAQQELTLIRARDVVVRLRTAAVNAVRGLVKPCGVRLPSSSTSCFAKRCRAVLPEGLSTALAPLLVKVPTVAANGTIGPAPEIILRGFCSAMCGFCSAVSPWTVPRHIQIVQSALWDLFT